MKKDKLIGWLCIGAGALLLLGALVLVFYNRQEDSQAEVSASEAVSALEAAAPAAASQAATEATEATDPTDPPTLSSQFLDGHEYVGYLVFPSLDRKLPVMKIEYLDDLQISPCLEQGSPYDNDAVICAHNYPSHFGPIRDWKGGEEVQFIGLEGNVIDYTVTLVETIEPTDVEKVMESEHDLVLYTCTPGGAKRVMIACDRV